MATTDKSRIEFTSDARAETVESANESSPAQLPHLFLNRPGVLFPENIMSSNPLVHFRANP